MVIHGKRGEGSTLWYRLIEIALVLMLVGAWFSLYASQKGNTLYARNYYSKDLALTLDIMHAAPGSMNLNYTFQQGIRPIEFHVFDGTVSFYDYSSTTSREDRIPLTYKYAKDTGITVGEEEGVPLIVELIKEGNNIKLDVKEEVNYE